MKRITLKEVTKQAIGLVIFLLIMGVCALIVGGSVSYFVRVHVPALRRLFGGG